MTNKHRSKFGMSGFIALLVSIVIGSAAGTLATHVPTMVEEANVKNARIANKFDIKTYIGWAHAYDIIGREAQILYSKCPNDKSSQYFHNDLGYPNEYLPDLITDFGIAVQKPYTSNYIFTQEKDGLTTFYNNESVLINQARTQFKPVNKSVNANDALVIEALKSYAILVDKLNSSTSTLTLEKSKNMSIGKYIKKDVGEKTFSQPLKYTDLALKYLATNLNTYRSAYNAYVKDGKLEDSDSIDNIINTIPRDN